MYSQTFMRFKGQERPSNPADILPKEPVWSWRFGEFITG